MSRSRSTTTTTTMPRHPLWTATLLLALAAAVNALHFYLDATEKRCFIEELPTDTMVEGAILRTRGP